MMEQIEPKIKKPIPDLIHYQLLPAILKRFCEIKNIAIKDARGVGNNNTKNRVLFIAVIIKLYNSELLTFIHTNSMRLNLREELTRVLDITTSNWISQQIDDIKRKLNPHRQLKGFFAFLKILIFFA